MFEFLLNEEELKIQNLAKEFVSSLDPKFVQSMDREDTPFPREFLKQVAQAGLLGIRFDEQLGGKGLGWTAEVGALEEFGTLGTTLACLYSMPSIVGEAISKFGTQEQKEEYLIPTLKGEKVCAEALTEPRGGSDFFGATTIAEDKGDYFVLNGQKRFIVGGEGADYFLVYARTNLDENSNPHERLSVLLVDRDDTVQVEHVYGLMGTRGGGTARIRFNDTKVPKKNLILGKNRGAEVFNQMMIPERMTSAAGALGMGRAALEVATKYSTKRKAFGQPIRRFQAVSFHIAEAVSVLDAARSLVWTTAKRIDAGLDSRRMVSESKKVATEAAWEIVNRSMQVMGGIGYTDVFPIEKMLRDVRLIMIWTGTNEIMNLLIQHEWYKERKAMPFEGRNIEKDARNAHMDDEKVFE